MGDWARVFRRLVNSDKEGFLYYVGRRDTLLKSSGYRISPTEIKEVLYQAKRFRQAAVIGSPDSILGQSIKAFVVAHDRQKIDPDDLILYCAERLPHYMVPKTVQILDDLPQTTSGKADYPALRRPEGL